MRMAAYEYTGNMHVHTVYSDGEGTHAEVADAALLAGLDFVIFTDHNVWLDKLEGYYGDDEKGYILLLSGEEVHDSGRLPHCNHLLVYDSGRDLSSAASDFSELVESVNTAGGLCFVAHPDDPAVEWMGEPGIPWVDRQVDGIAGLEIWNFMSSFKSCVQTRKEAMRAVFQPEDYVIGPDPQTLALWDEMLCMGRGVVGIGNADAHASTFSMGPVTHVVFPYDFLFSCVNTHILTKSPLTGEAQRDKRLLYEALRQGRAFIGYDIPGSTRGFRFSAQGQGTSAVMGERIKLGPGVTLQALAPARARIRIIGNGEVVAEERNVENLTYVVRHEGVYRVEVWRSYKGTERAWIFSNPIYVDSNIARYRW
jgi:hypothetical protein